LVNKFISGSNATVITFGQTGAGKTYTMYGGTDINDGIAFRALTDIFNNMTANHEI